MDRPLTIQPQIVVLDAGGQYCHLIARKVRELGVYAEVRPAETPAAELAGARGVIISGGPSSVYEPQSPTVDAAIFRLAIPVLGICYGHQLMAHLLGGSVERGETGEYGLTYLEVDSGSALFQGVSGRQQVWMSHRDVVRRPPPRFHVLAQTTTCPIAVMEDPGRRLYGVQFHPEVAHTAPGKQILKNFVLNICGCSADWDPSGRISALEEQIRQQVGDRKVFFFVSGGVDSTVAYALCLRALGPDRVHGAYVDTGFMREGETEFVRTIFFRLGARHFRSVDAQRQFLHALEGVTDPEQKRHVIGEQFVSVQEGILQSGHYLDADWILGQGTIYPDTIESGGTAKADKIKTHHNRVPGIQKLIDFGRVIEPLSLFYKDEVRQIGRELGIPEEMLERHPFPGPGLAIRCLCERAAAAVERLKEGYLLPVHSVGVQGDSRSYRPALALEAVPADTLPAVELINRIAGINRVVAFVRGHAPLAEMRSAACGLSQERLARLRRADAIVRRISHETGFDRTVWQFPVVLIPVGVPGRPDSVVLRPVDSVDGMTAQAVMIEPTLRNRIAEELLEVEGVCAVFCDLTHKPPATIEWE